MNPYRDKLERQSAGKATCRASGKLIYGSRKQARRARAQLVRGHELNVYGCDGCNGYHLGHMPADVRRGEVDKRTWLDRSPSVQASRRRS